MKEKVIIYTVVVVAAAGLGILFYRFSQPSGSKFTDEFKEKAVADLLGRKAELSDTTPQGEKIYKGKTISFTYPAQAIIYDYREKSTSSGSAAIEDFSFDIKEPKLVFNVRITDAPVGVSNPLDLPAVRLRETRLYEYKKGQIKLGNAEGIIYTKEANGGEKTGFWIAKGKVISIAITGSDISAVEDLFKTVVSSAEISGQ